MQIKMLDAAILLLETLKAASVKDSTWVDADRTLMQFRYEFNKDMEVKKELIESALAYLAECPNWKHPVDGISLNGFIKRITPTYLKYDANYRVFERKSR